MDLYTYLFYFIWHFFYVHRLYLAFRQHLYYILLEQHKQDGRRVRIHQYLQVPV